VEILFENRGGKGHVSLDIRLRDRQSGLVVESGKNVEVREKEQLRVFSDVAAPPGDYEVEVKAEYPPE
jgi:hypothetical protein